MSVHLSVCPSAWNSFWGEKLDRKSKHIFYAQWLVLKLLTVIRWFNRIEPRRTHKKYGAYTFHAGNLKLQNTLRMCSTIAFHCNCCCSNVPHLYVIRTLSVLLMLCTVVSKFSVHLYTLCNVMSSYISSPVFSRHTPFTLLLHQTVWQLWTQEALAAAVSVLYKCIATLNYVCLCTIFQYLPVPL